MVCGKGREESTVPPCPFGADIWFFFGVVVWVGRDKML